MKRTIHSVFIALVVAAVMLAWNGSAVSPVPVSVGYGATVPASCPALSPILFVQHGATGLVTISTCANGRYGEIWQAERFADAETPGGSIDGANATFTLAHFPRPTGSLQLMKNGVVLRQGVDYRLERQTITMAAAPLAAVGVVTADALEAWYRY